MTISIHAEKAFEKVNTPFHDKKYQEKDKDPPPAISIQPCTGGSSQAN